MYFLSTSVNGSDRTPIPQDWEGEASPQPALELRPPSSPQGWLCFCSSAGFRPLPPASPECSRPPFICPYCVPVLSSLLTHTPQQALHSPDPYCHTESVPTLNVHPTPPPRAAEAWRLFYRDGRDETIRRHLGCCLHTGVPHPVTDLHACVWASLPPLRNGAGRELSQSSPGARSAPHMGMWNKRSVGPEDLRLS